VTDAVVAPAWRKLGVGTALLRLLLDHPHVRGARTLRLPAGSRAALERWSALAAELGFREAQRAEVVLERDGAPTR
jgi:GNAT superfamily N-acetyltransferase